jgi:hypothetical protein
MAVHPAEHLTAKADGEGFHLHAAPARHLEMPVLMHEHDDGDRHEKRQNIAKGQVHQGRQVHSLFLQLFFCGPPWRRLQSH